MRHDHRGGLACHAHAHGDDSSCARFGIDVNVWIHLNCAAPHGGRWALGLTAHLRGSGVQPRGCPFSEHQIQEKMDPVSLSPCIPRPLK